MHLRHQSLIAVILFLVMLAACHHTKNVVGPGQHHGQQNGRTFNVYIYTDPTDTSHCYADASVVTLWKTEDQRVKWISDDDKEYFVDFNLGHNGSPFVEKTFPVPAHGDKASGKLTQSGQYYDYGIRAGNTAQGTICKPSSDPGIYVVK